MHHGGRTVTHRVAACPACGGGLHVNELGCEACGTRILGKLAHCPFCLLSDDERAFVLLFLGEGGSLEGAASHLGCELSAAKARLESIRGRLGAGEVKSTIPADPKKRRLAILRELSQGPVAVKPAGKGGRSGSA